VEAAGEAVTLPVAAAVRRAAAKVSPDRAEEAVVAGEHDHSPAAANADIREAASAGTPGADNAGIPVVSEATLAASTVAATMIAIAVTAAAMEATEAERISDTMAPPITTAAATIPATMATIAPAVTTINLAIGSPIRPAPLILTILTKPALR